MTPQEIEAIRNRVEKADDFAADCVSYSAETWMIGYGQKEAKKDLLRLLAYVEEL